jgi:hypothetical protein
VQLDQPVADGRVDLVALGPFFRGRQTNVVTASETTVVQETDTFLLATAQDLITELRAQMGPLEVVRPPEVIHTRTSQAVLFEVAYTTTPLHQAVAVVASEPRRRLWAIVFTIDSDSAAEYRPVYEAVFASFEVIPPGPLENPATMFGIVSAGAVAVAVAVVALGWKWRRRRPGPTKVSLSSTAVLAPAQVPPGLPALPAFPSARSPVAPSSGWPFEPPRFCHACGAPLGPPYRACASCGSRFG